MKFYFFSITLALLGFVHSLGAVTEVQQSAAEYTWLSSPSSSPMQAIIFALAHQSETEREQSIKILEALNDPDMYALLMSMPSELSTN